MVHPKRPQDKRHAAPRPRYGMEPVFPHLCPPPPRGKCRAGRDAPLAPYRGGALRSKADHLYHAALYEENKLARSKGYEYWLRTTAKTPRQAYPGQSWRFWQYSMTGLIDGIEGEVDLNLFNGNRAEWTAWLAARAPLNLRKYGLILRAVSRHGGAPP